MFEYGSYLAGLWEGDGHLTFPKKKNPVFGITFHIKDLPIAQKIKEIIIPP